MVHQQATSGSALYRLLTLLFILSLGSAAFCQNRLGYSAEIVRNYMGPWLLIEVLNEDTATRAINICVSPALGPNHGISLQYFDSLQNKEIFLLPKGRGLLPDPS